MLQDQAWVCVVLEGEKGDFRGTKRQVWALTASFQKKSRYSGDEDEWEIGDEEF